MQWWRTVITGMKRTTSNERFSLRPPLYSRRQLNYGKRPLCQPRQYDNDPDSTHKKGNPIYQTSYSQSLILRWLHPCWYPRKRKYLRKGSLVTSMCTFGRGPFFWVEMTADWKRGEWRKCFNWKEVKKEEDQQIMKKPSTNHITELYSQVPTYCLWLDKRKKMGHLVIWLWRRKLHVPPPLWSS